MNPTMRLTTMTWIFAIGFALMAALPGFANEEEDYENESTPVFRLVPSDPIDRMAFGEAVAASGDFAVVGAPNPSSEIGAAYVFQRTGDSWDEVAGIVPEDGLPGDQFGAIVAIDGDHLMVVAPDAEIDSIEEAGAVYMYRRVDDDWVRTARITNDPPTRRDNFGEGAVLHGETVAIGRTGVGTNARVILYTFDGTTWVQGDELVPDDPEGSYFGWGLDISERWLVVGDAGAPIGERIRAYERTESGLEFRGSFGGDPQRAKALGGTLITVSGDRIAALAGTTDGTASLIYIYEYDGTQWNRQDVLEGSPDDDYGSGLTLEGDVLLVGLPAAPDESGAGQAHFLTKAGNGWALDTVIQQIPMGGGDRPRLGTSGAIDSTTAIVGAPEAEIEGNIRCGVAYIAYAIPCRTGVVGAGVGAPEAVLFMNGVVSEIDRFIEINEGDAIIGAILDAPGGGSRYVIHANEGQPTPDTLTPLPAQVGLGCFPFLTTDGAAPLAVWNNIGREGKLGSNRGFDGQPIPDPPLAPTIFLVLHEGDPVNLPVGTTVTFQGVMLDGDSPSPRNVSATNAITLRVL